MKTFQIKAIHPGHKRIRIVCWSHSRIDTRFDIQFDGVSVLSRIKFDGRYKTYATMHILSTTNWVVKKINDALEILFPDCPLVGANELEAGLLWVVNICESKYGAHSDEENGDAEVVFS